MKRGFILILLFLTLTVITYADRRCPDYCAENILYVNGEWSERANSCEYSNRILCRYGCERDVCAEPQQETIQSRAPQESAPQRFIPQSIPQRTELPTELPTQQFIPRKSPIVQRPIIRQIDTDNDGVPETDDACPNTAEVKVDEKGCPYCAIDTDGTDVFVFGKVGYFVKHSQPNPLFEIDKFGMPKGSPVLEWLEPVYTSQDTCKSNILYEVQCKHQNCPTNSVVNTFEAMGLLSPTLAEQLNEAYCVLDTPKGKVTIEKKNCACGCKNGTCNEEKDQDKDSIPDCIDEDRDGDLIQNSNDNCPGINNPDQKDFDNDGQGDICDCDDFAQGLLEKGIDCDGPCQKCVACDWCGAGIEPLRIRGPWNKGYIDFVWVPEKNYAGNINTFKTKVADKIQNWIFKLDTMMINPLPADYREKFNFYIYTGGFGTTATCAGTLPPGFSTKVPYYDVAGILALPGTAWGCTNALGPPSHFISRDDRGDLVQHETGHGLFGLVDEYCGDTFYTQNDPKSNVWKTLQTCQTEAQKEGWTLGNCRKINSTGCSKNYYRFDRDAPPLDSFLTCCPHNPPYQFGEAASRRINYIFKSWPSNQTKGILLVLHAKGEQLTFVSGQVIDAHPDLGLQYGHYKMKLSDATGRQLEEYPLWDPRIALSDHGMEVRDDIDFEVRIPWRQGLKNVEFYQEGNRVLTTDVSSIITRYCQENPAEECQQVIDPNKATPIAEPQPNVMGRIIGKVLSLLKRK